ncbi:MAG: methyltransferase domain-containing protein [Pyrinomonadaceae bacterium]
MDSQLGIDVFGSIRANYKKLPAKLLTALRILLKGGVRKFVIVTDWKLGLGYLDFKKTSEDVLYHGEELAHGHQTWGPELALVLDSLIITSDDAIIDLGSGKGAALILMANYSFKRISGVELSSELTHIARRNIRRLGRQRRIEVICVNAANFTDLDHYNYVYMFNPFPCCVVNQVLTTCRASLVRVPRDLTIIYANPVCSDLILSSGLFNISGEFRFPNKSPIFTYFHHS